MSWFFPPTASPASRQINSTETDTNKTEIQFLNKKKATVRLNQEKVCHVVLCCAFLSCLVLVLFKQVLHLNFLHDHQKNCCILYSMNVISMNKTNGTSSAICHYHMTNPCQLHCLTTFLKSLAWHHGIAQCPSNAHFRISLEVVGTSQHTK